jgi:phosphate transport system protein
MVDTISQTRATLDRELIKLRDNILRISHMADTAIERAIQALKDQDVELARQVIADDKAINTLRYQIETDCYRLLALQQPTARDLRSVVTAIHIVVELERIGDHAESIATLATEQAKEPLLKPLIDVPRMAATAREMIHDGLNAYMSRDEALARRTVERDHEVDQLEAQIYRELLTFMLQDPRNITRATQLLWIAHHLERIGDRATNICERVIFMVTGEIEELNVTHERNTPGDDKAR